jgi:hypothetical protein
MAGLNSLKSGFSALFTPMSEKPIDHELSLEELFSQTFAVVRTNYTRVLPVFAAFGVVATAISTYIASVTPSLNFPSLTNISGLTPQQITALASTIGRIIGLDFSNDFLSWSLLYFATGIGIWMMNRARDRSSEVVQQKLNWFNLVITTILAVVIVELGVILIVIGALIFATMLYLCLAACTIEARSPLASLGRSKQLASGHWFRTFALLIGVQALVYLISNVLGDVILVLPLASGEGMIISTAVQNFTMALLFPLVSASMLVLYKSRTTKLQQVVVAKPPSPYDHMKPEPFGIFAATPSTQTTERVFCPHCGTKLAANAKYCHNCGAQQF